MKENDEPDTSRRKANVPAHLSNATAARLGATVQARINWTFRKRVIRHHAWEEAERVLLDTLYRREHEPAGTVLLTGPERNGKKTLLESLLPEHGEPYISEEHEPIKPIVWPDEPIADYGSYLADEVLKMFHGGYAENSDDPVDRAVRFLGNVCNVQLLVLDELWDEPGADIVAAIDRFRTEAGTSIVLTSTRSDEEGEAWAGEAPARAHVHLPAWTPSRALVNLLDDIEANIPLPEPSGLSKGAMMNHIGRCGKNTIGGIRDVVCAAAAKAIRKGQGRILKDDIRAAR